MVIEAVFELARARWLIINKDFKQWHERMGKVSAVEANQHEQEFLDETLERNADRLGKVIRKVARNVPFKANCLPQAAAAQVMLKRRGIKNGVVFLGARKGTNDSPLDFHAWLFVGSICVTGNDGPGDLAMFKPLVRYVLAENEA